MWTKIYDEESLAADTHWTNVQPGPGDIGLEDSKTVHSLELVVAGTGAPLVTITPYTSISGKNWISNGAVISSFAKDGGPDGDGMIGIPMSLIPGDNIRFKIVVADATATVSLWLTQK